jgi:hypothetical protein
MATVSVLEFAAALTALDKDGRRPKGKQLEFLQAHYEAPGRAATATVLAQKVHYKSFDAINLQYGILAARIAEYVEPGAHISLLVDLVRPASVTNKQWILVMRPEFANALKRAGWVH